MPAFASGPPLVVSGNLVIEARADGQRWRVKARRVSEGYREGFRL
jgi:hypothetical protein